jgi:hypothetical protein
MLIETVVISYQLVSSPAASLKRSPQNSFLLLQVNFLITVT